jgi:UDP:flavonoid glycosyltransferase YjiC (YdhE family)
MRFLFCPLGGAGFVGSAIAVARGLVARGHDVTFLTSPPMSAMVVDAGLTAWPGSERCAAAFEIATWGTAEAIVAQAWHTRRAAVHWQPDVIVTSQLALGPLLAREELDLPVAVIGLGAYLWPHAGDVPDPADCAGDRRRWYGADVLRVYEAARRRLGRPRLGGVCFERFPLLGDRYLLQSLPALEPAASTLPPSVACVGGLAWEPPPEPAVDDWLAEARADGVGVLYAQPGRAFGGRSYFAELGDAAGRHGLRLAAAIARADFRIDELPPRAWCRPHVSADQILPHAVATVANGHTTTVLASLRHGVPLVLVPNGSGTDVIADNCARAGAAIVLGDAVVSAERLDAALALVTCDPRYVNAARRLQASFSRSDGVALACHALVDLGAARQEPRSRQA